MGYGAWGMGHGAWGMGHGAWGIGGLTNSCSCGPLLRTPCSLLPLPDKKPPLD
ncbi:MAG: hypothetical protein KME33_20895 [Aetokthonos hydrillicola CCALA 1050]|nr:hypothetical protein [Aetokthonos hydrillicola CCALA 1050]